RRNFDATPNAFGSLFMAPEVGFPRPWRPEDVARLFPYGVVDVSRNPLCVFGKMMIEFRPLPPDAATREHFTVESIKPVGHRLIRDGNEMRVQLGTGLVLTWDITGGIMEPRL